VPSGTKCFYRIHTCHLGTRSHTSFLWNWLSSSCIASIHPSSESVSSTVVGSITDNNPIIDSSCLKYDLVLLGLSLFPMIWPSGCEDLYLNVFLDWLACWEPSCATSEATSSWASGVGSASGLSSDSSASSDARTDEPYLFHRHHLQAHHHHSKY